MGDVTIIIHDTGVENHSRAASFSTNDNSTRCHLGNFTLVCLTVQTSLMDLQSPSAAMSCHVSYYFTRQRWKMEDKTQI